MSLSAAAHPHTHGRSTRRSHHHHGASLAGTASAKQSSYHASVKAATALQAKKVIEGGDPCVRNIKKIFVGGIAVSTNKSKLMSYFDRFGTITDCIIMVDRDHKPRGFGFVTFDDVQAVEDVLIEADHYIDGKLVECKKAVPKDTQQQVAQATSIGTKSVSTASISLQSLGGAAGAPIKVAS
mmetsp:Transcript_44754/g.59433  ORF Transcript_44754/g.59433 Transcript_44754/m.59433 type:complete len:182 (-) Transcript_44754:3382-3927(-)